MFIDEPAAVIRIDRELRPPGEHPDVDRGLIEEVQRDPERPHIRLWRSSRSLVATRREQLHPAFAWAMARSAARGWPVVVRDSGGAVVPHDAGVLNVTMVRAVVGELSIDESYAALLDPIVALFKEQGYDARSGRVANSVCEGKYDLSLNGRKFCGSAQRCVLSRRAAGTTYVIAGHASIFCALDLDGAITAVADFYRDLTEPCRFERDAHTDLRLATGEIVDMHDLATALAAQYRAGWQSAHREMRTAVAQAG